MLTPQCFLSKELNIKAACWYVIFNIILLDQPVWATWQFLELVFHSTTNLKIASATQNEHEFASLHNFAATTKETTTRSLSGSSRIVHTLHCNKTSAASGMKVESIFFRTPLELGCTRGKVMRHVKCNWEFKMGRVVVSTLLFLSFTVFYLLL